MDKTMFMAFAMEQDEYDEKVRECARDIQDGTPIEEALDYHDVEYEDVLEALQHSI